MLFLQIHQIEGEEEVHLLRASISRKNENRRFQLREFSTGKENLSHKLNFFIQ